MNLTILYANIVLPCFKKQKLKFSFPGTSTTLTSLQHADNRLRVSTTADGRSTALNAHRPLATTLTWSTAHPDRWVRTWRARLPPQIPPRVSTQRPIGLLRLLPSSQRSRTAATVRVPLSDDFPLSSRGPRGSFWRRPSSRGRREGSF